MRFASTLHKAMAYTGTVSLLLSCSPAEDGIDQSVSPQLMRHIQMDLVNALPAAVCPPEENFDEILETSVTVAGRTRRGLYMQAPARAQFHVFLTPNSQFSSWVTLAPTAWQGSTDGAIFIASIILPDRAETVEVARCQVDPRRHPEDRIWHELSANISYWAGMEIDMLLTVDPGPLSDNSKDWCIWGNPIIWSPPLSSSSPNSGEIDQLLKMGMYRVDHDFYATSAMTSSQSEGMTSQTGSTTSFSLEDDTREGLYAHPPWTLRRTVLPGTHAVLCTGIGLIASCWDDSDGLIFRVSAQRQGMDDRTLFEYFLCPRINVCDRKWIDVSVDLSEFAYESVDITLTTSPGYRDDLNCDSGAWVRPIIISKY